MFDCGYSLEPPQLCGSKIYAQSVFRGKIKEKTTHQKIFIFIAIQIAVFCLSLSSLLGYSVQMYGRYKEHSGLLKNKLHPEQVLTLICLCILIKKYISKNVY